MECNVCRNIHRHICCNDCLHALLIEHRRRIHTARVERNRLHDRVEAALESDNAWQTRQATARLATARTCLASTRHRLDALKAQLEHLQQRRAALQERNATARTALDTAWQPMQQQAQQAVRHRQQQVTTLREQHGKAMQRLQVIRRVMLRELLPVFSVKRRSTSSDAVERSTTSLLEDAQAPNVLLTISGLRLPGRADWYANGFPRRVTNATCHLLMRSIQLIAYYLDERLPFMLVDQGTGSFGFRTTANGDVRTGASQDQNGGGGGGGASSSHPIAPLHLNDTNTDAFTRGFAMLCYNACYLSHCRGLDTSLENAPYVIWQVWRCCRAPLSRVDSTTSTNGISVSVDEPASTRPFDMDFDRLLRYIYSLQQENEQLDTGDSMLLLEREGSGSAALSAHETWDLVEMPLPPTPAQVAELEMWQDSQRRDSMLS